MGAPSPAAGRQNRGFTFRADFCRCSFGVRAKWDGRASGLVPLHRHTWAPDPRHNGRANVAFCDGRVEAMSLQDLGYVVLPDGSVAATAIGAHNRWFSGDGEDRDPPPIR
jgi:prepilin-type processing-associated H-X9-DG protein